MRRRPIILCLCLACLLIAAFALMLPAAFAAGPAPPAWTPQSSGVYESLVCAAVVDASTAWVVGGDGRILRTVDGGLTRGGLREPPDEIVAAMREGRYDE